MTKAKALAAAVSVLLTALVGYFQGTPPQAPPSSQSLSQDVVLGGTVENFPTSWVNGLKIGRTNQFSADFLGNVSSTGNLALNGSFVTYVTTTIQVPAGGNSSTAASSTIGPGYQKSGSSIQGGLTTIITSSTFNFGSSTLGCVQNPFVGQGTSTIDLAEILPSGLSTTSLELYFVTSTNGFLLPVNGTGAGYPASSSANIINSVQFASSTNSSSSFPIFVNGVNALGQQPQQVNYNYAALDKVSDGSNIVSSTFNFRVSIAPNEYECLYATSTNIGTGTGGTVSPLLFMNNMLYNASNTFNGNFILRWLR